MIPPKPKNDDEFLGLLAKIVFIQGFNWKVVENRWPLMTRAFFNFNIKKIKKSKPEDFLNKEGMINNEGKIAAVIKNAEICSDLIKKHGSIQNWVKAVLKESKKSPLLNPSLEEACETFFRIGKTTRVWVAHVVTKGKSKAQVVEA